MASHPYQSIGSASGASEPVNASAAPAWAPYCGAAPVPAELLARWNFDPILLAGLSLAAFVTWRWSDRRAHAGTAIALSVILFVSPFCALSSALFSARVTHHVVLTAVVAPLLVYALPVRIQRWRGGLAFWTGVQALTFWLWHAPPMYEAALSSDATYWAMQLTLLGTAVGFWSSVRRAGGLSAVAALLVSTVQMGLLGALITFARGPLFAPHYFTTKSWGYTPLQDQQLAGLIMWAPSAALYLAAALWVAGRWMAREDREIAA